MSRNIRRSRSVDNDGYLLKTSVFPISFGMGRSRRKKSPSSTGSLKAVVEIGTVFCIGRWWLVRAPFRHWWRFPSPAPAEQRRSSGKTSVVAMAVKSGEKEWWRTKPNESDISGGLSSSYSGTSSSSSSRNSSSSSTSSNRHGHSSRFLPGCCSFRGNK